MAAASTMAKTGESTLCLLFWDSLTPWQILVNCRQMAMPTDTKLQAEYRWSAVIDAQAIPTLRILSRLPS